MFIMGKFYSKFKVPKVDCLCFTDGSPKTGKTTFNMYLADITYRRNLRIWRIRVYFQKLLHRALDEMPLFYSNIPLNRPYVKLTNDLLLMKKRFRRKSVLFIDEASLLADSQLYKDDKINERLLMFCKMFGHITHGGTCIYNSHSPEDMHYSFKRTLGECFYIHHLVKWIPFFVVAYVREERYSNEVNIVNAYTEDVENSLRKVLIPKRVWKIFDAYAFSFLTDDKPCEDRVIDVKQKDLKARELVSFRQFINEEFRRYQDGSNSGRKTSDAARSEVCNKVCVPDEKTVLVQAGCSECDDKVHKGDEKE